MKNLSSSSQVYKKAITIPQPHKIKKAIAFPFNKEIHGLVLKRGLLKFNLSGIYDHKLTCQVNKNVNELHPAMKDFNMIVGNYEHIDWQDDFDTVILGHTRVLSDCLKIDFKKYFLDKCVKFQKNLYCFDDLSVYQNQTDALKQINRSVFYPRFEAEWVPDYNLNKLYRINCPVVSIFGTSPKQGKFTLQLTLKQMFERSGYKVGHFCTEPNGFLFGSNQVYPIGYDSTVAISGADAIKSINLLMHYIDENDPDIIITGSQSHTIPYNTGNIGHYPLSSHELLLGIEPDCCILCVNPTDELSYIYRTILYLENYIQTKVIALCVFPMAMQRIYSIRGNNTYILSEDDLKRIKVEIQSYLKKPVYILGCEADEKQIYQHCIDFF